jgi:esterase/lipase
LYFVNPENFKSILKPFVLTIIVFLAGILILYFLILLILYFFQEKLIFQADKLPQDYTFNFNSHFEEKWIETTDGHRINALLFKTEHSKGLILYLHGNAGSLESWGQIAPFYNSIGYDIFIPDYRGYGKSTGKIFSQKQLFEDVDRLYNELKINYSEENIVIIGYSLGTGPATYLASRNKPGSLILMAPYFSFEDLISHKFPLIPSFILKYPIPSNKYIVEVSAPIAIFHGKADELIYCHSSEKLHRLCKPGDKLYLIDNQNHGGINENEEFRELLRIFLRVEKAD